MDIHVLLLEMVKRISIAIVLGLLMVQTRLFDRLITHRLSLRDRLIFIAIFSAIAIAGTYAGIPVDDALANSRMIGIMAAGLIGGPAIGTTVGVIAGVHRYFLGGFTAFACAVSSIVEGIIAGCVQYFYPRTTIPWHVAFITGFLAEALQMFIILAIAPPFDLALILVSEIALPMILANSVGLTLFIRIMNDAMRNREVLAANQSHLLLSIARQTVSYLRKGLTPETAGAVVKIIRENSLYDAVSMTDTGKVLAFIGAEADHHSPENAHGLTTITEKTLSTGQIHLAQSHREIGCPVHSCTLHSAVVVPLKIKSTVIGTLKLYYTVHSQQVSTADVAFAQGLADLFSTQLELTEIDRQAKLTEAAKLSALQTQINPHFLFNTLNTISSLIRTNPDMARRLLIKFSHLFRFTLQYSGMVIPFEKEWSQVQAFLEISHVRQGDKLTTSATIAPEVLHFGIPSLTLQPIIENAIKHGLQPREMGGHIDIQAYCEKSDWVISVTDNGVGFDQDPAEYLLRPTEGHIGISNVHQRLQSLYGARYGLTIISEPEQGTRVTIRLPQEVYHDQNSDY